MKIFPRIAEWMTYLATFHVLFQLMRGKRIVEIAKGQKGDLGYEVKFEDGKLVARAGDSKLGIDNVMTIDGNVIVDAVIDLVESLIPGDQKAQAQWLKDVAHKGLAKQAADAQAAQAPQA